MDTSGKMGDPSVFEGKSGAKVAAFKVLTAEELAHDYSGGSTKRAQSGSGSSTAAY
jgi:hypothetical protein